MFFLQSLSGHQILVDEDVYTAFKAIPIYAEDTGKGQIYFRVYVWDSAAGCKKIKRLHRLIMNAPKGVEVDHIDHDYLDLRRSALRFANRFQNSQNRKPKGTDDLGVRWDKRAKKWRVQLWAYGRYIWGGYFSSPREAKLRHRELVELHHGAFGRPNRVNKVELSGSIQVC